MKEFNIVRDYKHIKIAQKRHINELLEKIKLDLHDGEKEIVLNIERCTTDYPATPIFFDYFFKYLSNQNGNKTFNIILDGLGNKEIYILYVLVLEGDFFNIHDKIGSEEDIEEWRIIINDRLIKENIVLKVTYAPENKDYIYGRQDD